MQTCSLALAQVHPYIHLPCTHITINNLFLKEEMKGVGHSLMGSLVHSFNHFSQQIYMSSTNMLVGCCNKQKCQNVCLQGDIVLLGRQQKYSHSQMCNSLE